MSIDGWTLLVLGSRDEPRALQIIDLYQASPSYFSLLENHSLFYNDLICLSSINLFWKYPEKTSFYNFYKKILLNLLHHNLSGLSYLLTKFS